jgi:hypothetical protein
MSDRDRDGIPTIYKGRQYRSRLEARWGCMFDLMGWPFEYEPFDLEGWAPDFLIKGHTRLLVEVRPVVDFPKDVAREMVVAAHGAQWTGELLILGASLSYGSTASFSGGSCRCDLSIGWLGERRDDDELDALTFDPDNEKTWEWYWSDAESYGSPDQVGLSSFENIWFDRIYKGRTGKDGWGAGTGPVVKSLWTKAGNLTQWRGRQSIVS